jgi:hypothetical protein
MRKAEGKILESKYDEAIAGKPASVCISNGPGMPGHRRLSAPTVGILRSLAGAQSAPLPQKKSVFF